MLEPTTVAERNLLEKVRQGLELVCGSVCPITAESDLTIRAAFLRDICVRPSEYGVDPRGICIRGGHIVCRADAIYGPICDGRLDLEAAHISFPIILKFCTIDGVVNISGARVGRFSIEASRAQAFWAGKAKVDGSLILADTQIQGLTTDAVGAPRMNGSIGQVILNTANIAGDLDCGGLKFEQWDPKRLAIDARNIRIGGNLYLNNGMEA
jgi:hypothetical protein